MIYFDTTKAGASGHRSGLLRVSARLGDELRGVITEVRWERGGWREAKTGAPVTPRREDWLLTGELFSEEERPGLTAFMTGKTCRVAGIFHDAIPLKWPQITWPQSVGRHPEYMKQLAGFTHVWAVSEASREELVGYWRWLGIESVPPVEVITLGADFTGQPRQPARTTANRALVCVGILEPRKNQTLLLDVAEELWREGLAFELHLVGRVNPHFGKPIERWLKALQKTQRGLQHHATADDATLARLYAGARASVFPTRAEGCGLPLIESLWQGVPCVATDLPVLRENAAGGGCVLVADDDRAAWKAALRRVLTDDAWQATLAKEAGARELPTWAGAAATLRARLGA